MALTPLTSRGRLSRSTAIPSTASTISSITSARTSLTSSRSDCLDSSPDGFGETWPSRPSKLTLTSRLEVAELTEVVAVVMASEMLLSAEA